MKTSLFKYSMIIFAMFFCTAIFSCKPIASKIIVKASPSLTLPLGSKEIQASTYISAEKIRKFLGANNSSKMEVYTADGEQLRYFIRIPIGTTDLNFDTSFVNKINEKFESVLPNQQFTVPTINKTELQTIEFSTINDKICSSLNSSLTLPPTGIAETGSPTFVEAATPLEISINFTAFSALTMKAGSTFSISTSVSNASADFEYGIVSATLTPEDLSPITGTVYNSGKDVSFPITNIKPKMTLKIKLKTKGGNSSNAHTSLSCQPKITGTIQSASGVNISNPIELDLAPTTIPITQGSFESATIGTGNITITKTLPSGWTGITSTIKCKIEQAEGLDIDETSNTNPMTISLADKTISKKDITIKPKVSITLNDASITNADANFSAEILVTKFSIVKIKPATPIQLTRTEKFPIDAELKKWGVKIHFNEVGVRLRVNNGLPAGNDIKITASSTAFDMAEQNETFPSGQTTPTTKDIRATDKTLDSTAVTEIDFTIKLELPDYDDANNILTVKNLDAGARIYFGATVTMIKDWDKVTVSPSDGYKGSYPEASQPAISLTALNKFFKQGISLNNDILAYFYVGGEVLQGISSSATAKIDAQYKSENTEKTFGLVSEGTTLRLRTLALPTPMSTAATLGSVPTDESVKITTLAEFLNKKPDDMRLSYNISIDTLEIPSYTGTNDLFNRTSTRSSINDSLKMVKAMGLTVTGKNSLGLGASLILTDNNGFEKTISLTQGDINTKIAFTADDVKHIINTVPFAPKFDIEIPEDTYKIGQTAGISVKGRLYADTDIEYTVYGGK